MSRWRIELEPIPVTGIPATQHLVLELDPRAPRMCIGPRNRTGGGPELWQRAVIQVPLELEGPSSIELQTWLGSTRLEELLDRISAGYRAEMLWSGDFIGHWSEDALSAVESLHAELSSLPSPVGSAASDPLP